MEPNKRIRIGDRVTIFRRGKKKIWCADFWRDGQHRRQSLKTADKKVAMGRGTKLAATLVDGTYHRPVPAVTIAETTDSYIEYLKTEDRARKTISKYRGIFDALLNFLREHGVTCMGQVTATHFDKFRAYHKQDHAVKSLYTDSIVVKQLFRWLGEREFVRVHPIVCHEQRTTEPLFDIMEEIAGCRLRYHAHDSLRVTKQQISPCPIPPDFGLEDSRFQPPGFARNLHDSLEGQ